MSVDDLIRAHNAGDAAATSQLLELLYAELHRIASRLMRRESPGHTLQTTALVVDEYAHFLDRHGSDADALRQHRVAARVLRSISDRLDFYQGSPLAYTDVVAGLAHEAAHIAPFDSASADTLFTLAIDIAGKRLGAEHELTSRVEHGRGAVAPVDIESDPYARLPWTVSKRNAMWGDNPWPEPAAGVTARTP